MNELYDQLHSIMKLIYFFRVVYIMKRFVNMNTEQKLDIEQNMLCDYHDFLFFDPQPNRKVVCEVHVMGGGLVSTEWSFFENEKTVMTFWTSESNAIDVITIIDDYGNFDEMYTNPVESNDVVIEEMIDSCKALWSLVQQEFIHMSMKDSTHPHKSHYVVDHYIKEHENVIRMTFNLIIQPKGEFQTLLSL